MSKDETPFFIGLLTKSFTALAVMQLVKAGKVNRGITQSDHCTGVASLAARSGLRRYSETELPRQRRGAAYAATPETELPRHRRGAAYAATPETELPRQRRGAAYAATPKTELPRHRRGAAYAVTPETELPRQRRGAAYAATPETELPRQQRVADYNILKTCGFLV